MTAAQRQAMAHKIASMPEVEVYAFKTKAQAVVEYEQMMQHSVTVTGTRLPASFRIVVRRKDEVRLVTGRFYDDPLVDNGSGVRGVQFEGQWSGAARRRPASPSRLTLPC